MPITLSTQTLVIILVVVLVIVFALMLSKAGGRTRRTRGGSAAPRATRTRGKTPRTQVGKPTAAQARAHKNIDMADHGAAVASEHGKARSPEWPAVAHEHLSHEPACVVCGHTGVGLNVHHIRPFHLFPELELDPNNLITLCQVKGRDHHLLIGHLDNWSSYNLNVRPDSKRYANESAKEIKANPSWQKEEMARP